MNTRTAIGWRAPLAVLLGGALGTGIRLAIDLALPHTGAELPWATLVVNVVGSFVLGALVSVSWPRLPVWARAGLGTGLLGSFTTFSALTVSLVAMGSEGEWMLGAAYLAASLLLGLGAASAGLALGRRRPIEGDTE